MAKKQLLAFLILGIVSGLILSACGSTTSNVLTVRGEVTNTQNIKFERLPIPLTVNITADISPEAETLMAQVKDVAVIRTVVPAEKIGVEYAHSCENDSLMP